MGSNDNAMLWSRYLARYIDYMLFAVIVINILNILDKTITGKVPVILYSIPLAFFWIFFEAILISVWGSTPGKALLGITVRNSEGGRLRFPASLFRSFSVWMFGIGMGLPIISWIAPISSYGALKEKDMSKWDKWSRSTVIHKDIIQVRMVLAVLIFSGMTLFYLHMINDYYSTKADSMPSLDQWVQAGDWKNVDITDGGSFAETMSSQGYNFMMDGKYEEAKDYFLRGLGSKCNDYTKDTLMNNLSWAYFSLGDYVNALKYIKQSLEILDNTDIEYNNYGNALKALGNVDEAEKAYDKAIELNERCTQAYWGKGQILYENGDYLKAIDIFTKHTELEKDDPDSLCYLGLSYLYGKQDKAKAMELLNKAKKMAPEKIFVLDSLVAYYNYNGETEKSEELYTNALKKNEKDKDLLYHFADYYKNQSRYANAVKYYDRAIAVDLKYIKAYKGKAEAMAGDGAPNKQLIGLVNEMVAANPDDANAYDTAGDIYYNCYEYKLAIEMFNKALTMDPLNEDTNLSAIAALYHSKHYNACLDFCLSVESKFNNHYIPWYIGSIYSRLADSDKALEYFNKALAGKNDDTSLLMDLGWEYFRKQDFSRADSFADKVLKIDNSNQDAKELKKSVGKRNDHIADQVGDFIVNNYMYYNQNSEFDRMRKNLVQKDTVSAAELDSLFKTACKKDDIFSFFLYGENYKEFLKFQMSNTVEYRSYDHGIEYIKISNFVTGTANDFLNCIEKIENPEQKYLVLDLRGNSGGDTQSGCDILDFLLPDCVVCNLIDKNGYSSQYYSDNDFIGFKHIFILTDKNTASCAELISLGLKTYIGNVTIIGEKTFGKGIGQTAFEDKNKGFIIFAVNHFWNVRETNIMDKGIEPDIKVNSSSLKECMDVVNKVIAGKVQ